MWGFIFDDFVVDRELESYCEQSIRPCIGCEDFINGECISKGGCATERIEENGNY